MKQYLDIMERTLSKGKWKGNRTGIRTLTLPNQFFSHDMEDGFPAITTKKLAFKTLSVELEGFINGITDKKWFQERGCFIWNSWSNTSQIPDNLINKDILLWQKENPDLGPLGYSHGWRHFGKKHKPIPFIWTGLDKEIVVNFTKDPFNLVGKDIDGKYGIYTVISYDGRNKYHNARYTVKFKKTGFVKYNLNKRQIVSKNVFDPYFPSILNIACVGDYQKSKYSEKLLNQWRQMIHRCYNPNAKAYKNYGAQGVYVHNDWLIFENFLNDVMLIDGWKNKTKEWKVYQLDKDIKGGNCYSKKNCLWVSESTNLNYTRQNYFFDAISPNGTIYRNNLGMSKFCNRYNLNTKAVEASIKNKTYTHNGWKFIRKNNFKTIATEDFDQFDYIVQTLKKNPDDRRMVCSAWNPNQLHLMALPPCHFSWSVTHIDGILSLHWTQRSCDLFLGVPFNIASYGLLLALLCKESNLKPGNLSGTLCDCHIYENHIDQCKEQLSRSPKQLPTLEFLQWNGIYDWTHKDVVLKNYYPHNQIKAEVAV